MAYHGVARADAMAQPALAAAVQMFEASEPAPLERQPPRTLEARLRDPLHRRRFPRRNLRLPLAVIGASNEAVSGESLVVSEGGMCASLMKPLTESEVVTVAIGDQNSGQPLRIRGAIRNRVGTSHGIAFFALSEEERAQLRRIFEGNRAAGD